MNSKLETLREIWDFLRVRKRFWMTPIFVILILFGLLLVLTESSAVAPFVYTLF